MVDVLPGFLLACLVLAVLPGPATALYLHRTVRDGRKAGLAAVAGNEIGVFAWTLAGGAGMSVLLVANRYLSVALHVVGALVLLWLGVQAWRGSATIAALPTAPAARAPPSAPRSSRSPPIPRPPSSG